ncbi:hypothetical protein AX15_006740 [Amanita polypyramis BW_CC]|nr:hypothetical protein AX15_006740 [Amanita polypyramis BW_CC]
MSRLTSALHPEHGSHIAATTTIQISEQQRQWLENCTGHLVYTLPPLVFIDKYELANYHESYSFQHWGTSNLEYPVFAVDQSDSILLLNIRPIHDAEVVQIRVPLHLRYGKPVSDGSPYEETKMRWPEGVFACPTSVAGPEPSNLPDKVVKFITQNLTHSLSFVPIEPSGKPEHVLRVPVGRSDDLKVVGFGTVLSICLFFYYLIRVVKRVAVRLQSRDKLE